MNIIIKYIISGGTAAVVDLAVLNFLDSLGMYYVLSVNIAFIIAFFVSFCLQKYWTFNDAGKSKTHNQLIIYFAVSVSNAFLNTLIIHILLSYGIVTQISFIRPVIIAQIISGALIAFESFIIYRYLHKDNQLPWDDKTLDLFSQLYCLSRFYQLPLPLFQTILSLFLEPSLWHSQSP